MKKRLVMFQWGIASAIFLSSCSAIGQKVVLKADGVPATLSILNSSTRTGGGKSVSYALAINSTDCKLTTSGVAKFYRTSDGMTDSAYLPDGDNVKTNQFIDKNAVGETIITMDIESKIPKYANVMVINAVHRTDGCFKAKYGSYEFYRK